MRLSGDRRLWAVWGIIAFWWVIRILIVHSLPPIQGAHLFAWPHIIFSWIAELSILSVVLFDSVRCNQKILPLARMALFCQGMAIVLGMFWAFDDFDWGSLWQWDFIEISSLFLGLALYGWIKSGQNRRFWWIAILGTLLIWQTAVLYGGLHSVTRHAYGRSPDWGFLLTLVIWFAVFLISSRYFQGKDNRLFIIDRSVGETSIKNINPSISDYLAGFLMMGTMGIYRPDMQNWVWCVAAGVIWCLVARPRKNEKRWISWARMVCGCITVIWTLLLPGPAEVRWLNLEESKDDFSLAGIEVDSADETCIRYIIWIRKSENEVALPLETCGKVNTLREPVRFYIPSKMESWRLQALEYRAQTGVLVRIQNILTDTLFSGWILLLVIGGFGFLIRSSVRKEVAHSDLHSQ